MLIYNRIPGYLNSNTLSNGENKMNQDEKIKRRYNRAAQIYDLLESPMEIMALKKWRMEVIKDLMRKVLEVGVGTGKNIEYYPNDIDITAIDFRHKMLKKARQKARMFNKKVDLIDMDAQNMRFPDNTFDTVFTACVLCSVPDPVKGLKEIRRVCKPTDRIFMICLARFVINCMS